MPMRGYAVRFVYSLALLQLRKCIVIPGLDVSHGDLDMARISSSVSASPVDIGSHKVNDLDFISWRNPEQIFH